mgnify:CR=1 FL=1
MRVVENGLWKIRHSVHDFDMTNLNNVDIKDWLEETSKVKLFNENLIIGKPRRIGQTFNIALWLKHMQESEIIFNNTYASN